MSSPNGDDGSNPLTGHVNMSARCQLSSSLETGPTKLPTAEEVQLLIKDRKKIKRLIRCSDWPASHPIRCKLWVELCSNIDDSKVVIDEQAYRDSVQEIFGEGDEELHAVQLPPFIDESYLIERHLSASGISSARRVLCVIGHERPDITCSPTLFSLTCLLLHYLDEAACYACVRALIVSKQRYIAQTNISYQARTLVLRELARKHVKSWYHYVTKKGLDLDVLLSQWQWWILRDLQFSHLVRVIDCYLYEGPKILYRVALAILILYHKHMSTASKHCPGKCDSAVEIEADIRKFCANLPVSCSKLFKTAFGIRGMSRSEMRKLILKMELYVQSKQNAAVLSASIPPSQSTGSLTVVVGHVASEIVNHSLWQHIYKWLPKRFALNQPKLVFSTSVHGTSLNTFFSKVSDHEPTFIAIKTDTAEVFGAFCSTDWSNRKSQQRNRSYFGTGETFVCTLLPTAVKYPWVGIELGEKTPHSAQLFMSADTSQICIGGGGGCAITLDEDLLHGRSQHCDTFNNKALVSTSTGNFVVVLLEVFSFD